jgi:electron transfer flavoprotein alpha subunit
MSKSVFVYLEHLEGKPRLVSYELLSEAHSLLKDRDVEIVGVYVGPKIDPLTVKKFGHCGAHKVIVCEDDSLLEYDTHRYSKALSSIVSKYHPDVFLIGSTLVGRDLGPRLSARIQTGLTADATSLAFEFEEDKLILAATRPALGGNLFATILCPSHVPQMATVRPGVFEIREDKKRTCMRINEKYIPVGESKVVVVKKDKIKKAASDITEAKLIVAGGRGVSKSFGPLKSFADLINADVAASRAVVDAKIQTKDRQVGQTGVTVKPGVYVALGISGAIQHIAGMEKSELIIAVNTDPNALIFDIADVSLICDANALLPLLVSEFKVIRGYKDGQ